MRGDAPTLGDVIRRFGPALVEQRGARLTPAQHAVLSTLGRCHTAALGGHLYRCDTCGAERPAYNFLRQSPLPLLSWPQERRVARGAGG